MQQFKKLNIQTPIEYGEYHNSRGANRILGKHEKTSDDGDYRSIRKYIPRSLTESFIACLPSALYKYASGVAMTEITLLPPHVHTKEMCIINFYQKAYDEVTTFYDGEIQTYDTNSSGGCNGYLLCKPELLTPVGSFVAGEGSVYLLNARAPHCVGISNSGLVGKNRYKPVRKEKRIVIQVFLDLPFEEVAGSFQETV